MAAGGLFHERSEEEDTCRMAAMAFAMIRAAKLVHVPVSIRYWTSQVFEACRCVLTVVASFDKARGAHA